jgi:hypothetical protein
MKRLVICCDGTWKRSDDVRVSNIEKIARAIRPQAADGTPQLVYSSNGVGTNGFADHLVGGAFGVGLDNAIIGAYRFLALNYQPGDEIYVFGFSRGAYTARSLVGMIATIGLLTPHGVVEDNLPNAMAIYKNRPQDGGTTPEIENYRKWTYPPGEPKIRLLGVFDTVGALGAPGLTRKRYQFHNVDLTNQVQFARQALAIDERRLTFTPCLWEKKDNTTTDIKQVWFEGVHSDIGGGYKDSAPADLTLRWMVRAAQDRELEFDYDLFEKLEDEPLSPNKSMTPAYELINFVKRFLRPLRPAREARRSRGDRRVLAIKGVDATDTMWIAQPAYDRWLVDNDDRTKRAPNIRWWSDWVGDLADRVEIIPPLEPPVTTGRSGGSAHKTAVGHNKPRAAERLGHHTSTRVSAEGFEPPSAGV